MEASNDEHLAYLDKVFSSIRKNADALVANNQRELTELLKLTNSYYLSLFSKNEGGIFQKKQMDKSLAKIPKPRCEEPTQSSTESESSQSILTKTRKEARRGLGKGAPGCSRKEEVTKRQKKNRSKPGYMARKRKADEINAAKTNAGASTSSEQPSSKRSASHTRGAAKDTPPSTLATQEDETQEGETQEGENQRGDKEPSIPEQTGEERQPLCAQVLHAGPIRSVSLIQTLAGAPRDRPPTSKELELYWVHMDAWEKLDERLINALYKMRTHWIAQTHNTLCTNSLFIDHMLRIKNTANGVTNCVHHILGSMVKAAVEGLKEQEDNDTTTKCIEVLCNAIIKQQYSEYVKILEKCGCESCSQVLEFDASYNRYHDSLESNVMPDDCEEPLLEKRPMHCEDVEIEAQYLKNKYTGLSDSTLTKFYYFANDTPPFSPPAVSLGCPTQVLEVVNKYMQWYQRERKLDDPLPKSWCTKKAAPNTDDLVEVDKDKFHLYDGDSCEIHVPPSSSDSVLSKLITHRPSSIRVRMPHHDAPETQHSVRIYKQSTTSITMTPFLTRHLGMETLRIARQAVFEAQAVYLHVPRDRTGEAMVQLDIYRRILVDVWLYFGNEDYRRLSEYLASTGHTLAFYTTGIDGEIYKGMQSAMTKRIGLFNLPHEIFCYPFRPWDLRLLERGDGTPDAREMLTRRNPILNPPENPEVAWKPNQLAAPVGCEDEEDSQLSEQDDSFYFSIVDCPLESECLCFRAPSTIPSSGYGLFLKQHFNTIQRETHLCLYSEKSTTKEELLARNSTRNYLVETMSGLFDADKPTGNNLGRYANQRGILEALRKVKDLSMIGKPAMTSDDWKAIEDELELLANAHFKVVLGQLVVVSKEDLHAVRHPTEIFVNYGSLRSYWISAERETPGCFGGEISAIIDFLLNSDQCNWTADQRHDWSFR